MVRQWSKKEKLKKWEREIQSIALHGSRSWELTKAMADRLRRWELIFLIKYFWYEEKIVWPHSRNAMRLQDKDRAGDHHMVSQHGDYTALEINNRCNVQKNMA